MGYFATIIIEVYIVWMAEALYSLGISFQVLFCLFYAVRAPSTKGLFKVYIKATKSSHHELLCISKTPFLVINPDMF